MPAAPPSSPTQPAQRSKEVRRLPAVVVRFAGDSGDGMQLAGTQFTDTSAVVGNDVATLPDFPAEIRAPAGTVAGVSGFQVNFASQDIFTPGDRVQALIAMNPAALKAHLSDVEPGGIVIVNEDEFGKVNLRKAGYAEADNPLDDESLRTRYQFVQVPVTRMNEEALSDTGMGAKDIGRCKNMWALGLVYWLFGRPLDTTIKYLEDYFAGKKKLPEVAQANVKALKAGYYFGETAELFPVRYEVGKAPIAPGLYRKITGNEALAMGLIAAGELAGRSIVYAGYPITPASSLLHALAAQKHFDVRTVPGRGRDRGGVRRDWCELCGSDRRVRHQRAGHLSQGGGDWAGDHHRAAADRGERAAGRAEHGAADQDGAERPVAGVARAEW